jgi:hypothetical protein
MLFVRMYSLIMSIIVLFGRSQSLLSEDNFDSLTHAVVQFLAKRIEELILKKKFTFVC